MIVDCDVPACARPVDFYVHVTSIPKKRRNTSRFGPGAANPCEALTA